MSKKNKIAIALLGALFSNNSASAMNTNKNINFICSNIWFFDK